MKNSLILENSEITLYSTNNDGTNRLFINNVLIPSSDWVGTGVYTFQNITIHKAESLTGNLMLKKLADFEYFFVNVALKKIYASEVIFDPTESGIPADNVQDAIDGIFLKMFPIGSLYMTATDTNPGTFIGGTWERWGAGRVPVGYDSTDSDFDAAEKTGGSKTKTLSTTEIPSHNHSVGAHAHGLNSHTHTYTDYYASTPSGSTTLDSTQIPSHRHSYGGGVGIAWDAGRSTHFIAGTAGRVQAEAGTTRNMDLGAVSLASYTGYTGGGTGHTHTVSNTYTTRTSNGASGNTANSTAFDSGNTGGGNAFSLLQPFITCFIWKRTA